MNAKILIIATVIACLHLASGLDSGFSIVSLFTPINPPAPNQANNGADPNHLYDQALEIQQLAIRNQVYIDEILTEIKDRAKELFNQWQVKLGRSILEFVDNVEGNMFSPYCEFAILEATEINEMAFWEIIKIFKKYD